MSAPTARDALGPLRGAQVVLVTSYRSSGQGVGTPVGIALEGGKAYFTTRAKTWKVRRIANNPRVTLAPCTRRGKVTGETMEGVARRLDEDEAAKLKGSTAYRIWVLIYRVLYRDRPVSYEVTPVTGQAPG